MKNFTLMGIVCLVLAASPASAGVDYHFPWDFTPPTFAPPSFDPPTLPTLDDVKAKIEVVKAKVEEKYASLPTPGDWPTCPTLPTFGDWPTCPSLGDWPDYPTLDCPSLDDWKAKVEELKTKLAEKCASLPSKDDWPTYPSYDAWKAKLDELKQKAEDAYGNLPTPGDCDWPDPPSLDELKAKLDAVKQELADKFSCPPDFDPPTCPTSDEIEAKIDAWKEKIEQQKQEIADKQEELIQKYEDWAQSVVDSVKESTATEFCDGLYDLTDGQYLGSSTYLMTGGTLMGSGVVDGLFQQWGGIFAPGHSPGLIEFTGDYALTGGELQLEIAGDGGAPGVDLDYLDVAGDALLDSTVKLLLLYGFVPDDQATFDVMTAQSIVFGDDFLLDQTGLAGWGGYFDMSLVDGGRGQILRLTAVDGLMGYGNYSANPEPSTLIMLATAGLCLAGYRWRRRRAARG